MSLVENNIQQLIEPQKKNKKKVKKTIFIEMNKDLPIGGKFNNINGHVFKPTSQDNSIFRKLGSWSNNSKQTHPPTIKIKDQFQTYPSGQITLFNSQEPDDIEDQNRLNDLRKAAETHRQVRKFAQQIIRPGVKLIDICNKIEDMNRYLIDEDGLLASIAFPTGCSLNNVAAHYTPNTGDETILNQQDVCKIDFGCQINGRIIDCAFTVAFDQKFDNLLDAVKASTNEGIKQAGVDVRMADIGAAIYEVMTSYEVEIDGKIYQVNPCKTLSGHSIADYIIHAGKQVPSYDNGSQQKMIENELYAIETFGSTGDGSIIADMECSHYMRTSIENSKLKKKSKDLLNFVDNSFGRLAFCRKWLDQMDFSGHILALKDLENNNLVKSYPPLCEKPGTYVAQWEHTILLRKNAKEVLSRGEDY